MSPIHNKIDTKSNSSRIEYIDLAKGICIFLVVAYHMTLFYHVSFPASNFFSSFRMPLYFFLSGCFFKSYDGFADFVRRKTNKLLIPFFFFYIVCSFLIPNLLGELLGINIRYVPMERIFTAFIFKDFYPAGAIWFLLCLFVVNCLFYLVYLLVKRLPKPTLSLSLLSVAIGCMGIFMGLCGIDLPLHIDTAFSVLPFFMFGYVLFRKTSLMKPNAYDRYLPLFIIVAFALVYSFCPVVGFRRNAFSSSDWFWVYPCGIMGVLGIVMSAKLVKYLPLVSYFGRYSIMILVTHDTVFHLFSSIINKFGLGVSLSLMLNLSLTFLSYLLIIPFMRRFMPHVTAQKDVLN